MLLNDIRGFESKTSSPLIFYLPQSNLSSRAYQKILLYPVVICDIILMYQEQRTSLNAEIDHVLAEITEKLGGATK